MPAYKIKSTTKWVSTAVSKPFFQKSIPKVIPEIKLITIILIINKGVSGVIECTNWGMCPTPKYSAESTMLTGIRIFMVICGNIFFKITAIPEIHSIHKKTS